MVWQTEKSVSTTTTLWHLSQRHTKSRCFT